MSWIATAVMVGSAVVNMEQQKQVARKQDNQLAAQLRQQSASEDKVRGRTQQFIQQQQQDTTAPQKQQAQTQLDTALKANAAMAQAPSQSMVGNVSDAYKKASQDAALGVAQYGQNRATTIAGMEAPALNRQANVRNIANFGTDVNQINRQQRSQDYLDQMKLNSIHANPWVSMLTGIAGGLARAKMGAGAGASPGGYDLDANTAAGGIDLSGSY